jgi:UTP--glucose-1-phosphate uridylyltransferase
MSTHVRKAVFPAAGLGTRFLPATKAQAKEMLPILDKPTIQYGVEEAVASGISNLIVVTGRGKVTIEDHFDRAYELEALLASRGRHAELQQVQAIASLARLSYVRQGEALGLGHAVLTAEPLVGDEPFAVVLSDDLIDATLPVLAQMLAVFERANGPVIAVERVGMDRVSEYGVIAAQPAPEFGRGVYRITDLVEKPRRDDAPSDLAIVGRYVLTPDIFDALRHTAPGRSGEIQLTDGLRRLLIERPIYAYEFEGVRHDTGHPLGFVKAVAYFALKRPDLAGPLREYLAQLETPR